MSANGLWCRFTQRAPGSFSFLYPGGADQRSLMVAFVGRDTRIEISALSRLVAGLLEGAGADKASTAAVTKAVIDASGRGVDTHGVILVPHYLKALLGGRINGAPRLQFEQRAAAVGYLDADNGFGHLAGYEAVATRLPDRSPKRLGCCRRW